MSFLPTEEVKISYSVYRKLADENKRLQNELIDAKKQLSLYSVVKSFYCEDEKLNGAESKCSNQCRHCVRESVEQ